MNAQIAYTEMPSRELARLSFLKPEQLSQAGLHSRTALDAWRELGRRSGAMRERAKTQAKSA